MEQNYWNVVSDCNDGDGETHTIIEEEDTEAFSATEGAVPDLAILTTDEKLRNPMKSSVLALVDQLGLSLNDTLRHDELLEWLVRLKYSPREAEFKSRELLAKGTYTVREMSEWWVELAISSDHDSQQRLLALENTARNWATSPVKSMQKVQEEELYNDSGTDSDTASVGINGSPEYKQRQPPKLGSKLVLEGCKQPLDISSENEDISEVSHLYDDNGDDEHGLDDQWEEPMRREGGEELELVHLYNQEDEISSETDDYESDESGEYEGKEAS